MHKDGGDLLINPGVLIRSIMSDDLIFFTRQQPCLCNSLPMLRRHGLYSHSKAEGFILEFLVDTLFTRRYFPHLW